MSTHTFLPYVRQGVAAALHEAESRAPGTSANPSIAAVLNTGRSVSVPLRLYRPGDVTGFDARVVVRTSPPHLAGDFERNYLPLIEFDRPDFPWLFTPIAATSRLTPWITLVVVPKDLALRPESPTRDGLPILTCASAELPDLAEAWAWAHAQVLQLPGESVEDVLRTASDRNVSRLMSPRRLDASRSYYACVVPTFLAGVAAALGEPAPDDESALAWTSASPDTVSLPVYYFWEFSTGPAGDFEALVKRLRALSPPPAIGTREMLLDEAAPDFPDAGTIGLEGALMAPGLPRREWPDAGSRAFVSSLERALEAGHDGPPLVGVPLYGGTHAGVTSPAAPAPWVRQLNLDPRYRVAAALGVRVVQEQQEHLMASAWEQLGDVRRANQLIRQAQLARVVGERTHEKRLAPLGPTRALQIAAPVAGRLVQDGVTLAHTFRRSALPSVALSPAFRRFTRPRGPIGRRALRTLNRARTIEGLAQGEPLAARTTPRGMVTLESVLTASAPVRPGPAPGGRPPRPGGGSPPVDPAATRFRDASARHDDALGWTALSATPTALPSLELNPQAQILRDRLRPSLPLASRMRDRIRRPAGTPPDADPLAPIVASPVFPQPMYEPLRDLGHEFVLPGLDRVPVNTVSEIAVNSRFVEAYMVGLNHEMARELLWREFPADLRETCFRRFWEPGAAATGETDIADVEAWTGPLGTHSAQTGGDLLVFVIRGDLVRRYPGAIVYLARARWTADQGRALADEERYPLLQGSLPPDVIFFGFRMSAAEARGFDTPDRDPGWYVVFQEQPTELRFGLDEFEPENPSDSVPSLERWSDLTWAHARVSGAHLSVALSLPAVTLDGVEWGKDAATLARILLQRPVRLAMHASTLLASPE
jgi:hypothetical protein